MSCSHSMYDCTQDFIQISKYHNLSKLTRNVFSNAAVGNKTELNCWLHTLAHDRTLIVSKTCPRKTYACIRFVTDFCTRMWGIFWSSENWNLSCRMDTFNFEIHDINITSRMFEKLFYKSILEIHVHVWNILALKFSSSQKHRLRRVHFFSLEGREDFQDDGCTKGLDSTDPMK